MAFTAQLGKTQSELGNIELGLQPPAPPSAPFISYPTSAIVVRGLVDRGASSGTSTRRGTTGITTRRSTSGTSTRRSTSSAYQR